jgi:hypothetical protein
LTPEIPFIQPRQMGDLIGSPEARTFPTCDFGQPSHHGNSKLQNSSCEQMAGEKRQVKGAGAGSIMVQPIRCRYRAVMERTCASGTRSHRSIQLTFQKKLQGARGRQLRRPNSSTLNWSRGYRTSGGAPISSKSPTGPVGPRLCARCAAMQTLTSAVSVFL